MDDLIAFLRARLDHLELAGRTMTAQLDREWTLADVAAKRQIIATWSLVTSWPPDYPSPSLADQLIRHRAQQTLKLLALPYAGHPDYREEWKP